MLHFVLGDFSGGIRHVRIREGDLGTAGGLARAAEDAGVDGGTGGRDAVELSFEVFEVEREIQDVGGRRAGRIREPPPLEQPSMTAPAATPAVARPIFLMKLRRARARLYLIRFNSCCSLIGSTSSCDFADSVSFKVHPFVLRVWSRGFDRACASRCNLGRGTFACGTADVRSWL